MSKIVVNLSTGERTVEPYTAAELADLAARQPEIQAGIALQAKQAAAIRIKAIREELVEHLATNLAGTPAEKGQALAAIGLLRAELALEKAKL